MRLIKCFCDLQYATMTNKGKCPRCSKVKMTEQEELNVRKKQERVYNSPNVDNHIVDSNNN